MTTSLDRLRARRQELEAVITPHKTAVAPLELHIAGLQAQADALAQEFRSLFAAAAAAHASAAEGSGAQAAALAAQGRAAEAQCRAINNQANTLRQQIKEAREPYEEIFDELRQLNHQIRQLERTQRRAQPRRRQARRQVSRPQTPLDKIQYKGFHRAQAIDADFVRQMLREVPEAILEQIESVAFVDELQPDLALGRTAAKPRISELARIHVFPHPFEWSAERQRADYRETILHESGHVLFERLLTEMQRFKWGVFYLRSLQDGDQFISDYAKVSKREDFAECVMTYLAHPMRLLTEQPERYAMIEEIMEALEA